MTDPTMWMTISGASFAAILVLTIGALKGWRDWIGLQRLSIQGRASGEPPMGIPSSAARIELADLKERVRKLEAIAAGVDL